MHALCKQSFIVSTPKATCNSHAATQLSSTFPHSALRAQLTTAEYMEKKTLHLSWTCADISPFPAPQTMQHHHRLHSISAVLDIVSNLEAVKGLQKTHLCKHYLTLCEQLLAPFLLSHSSGIVSLQELFLKILSSWMP